MSENLPIIWDDKVNSPELLAYFQQFGKNTYVSAEELNQIRDGINELSFPNGFIKTSPLTRVDNEISIAPLDFKWILNKIIFENTNSYSTTINAALDGYYRKDIIVANASGSFQKVEGDEYVDIAFRPDLPLNTLLVYEIDVFGASVIGSTSPVVSNYIEKGEFAESTMTGDSYMHFGIPQYSSVRFVGNATVFKGVYLFPGYKAYSGKKLTLKNFQTTDILLKHLHPDALLNTQLYFPNKADYILKPGKIIEFSLSMIANRFEFIGDSEDVAGKEDKSNKGIAGGYVPLNSAVKIAAEYLSIVNDLITGGATSLLSAEQGKQLKIQVNAINTLLTSDNVNLDSLQELVDAIETVQTSLSTILVNDLTTGGVTKGLTAEMGKSLKVLIDDLTTIVSGKQANLTDVNFGSFQSVLPTVSTVADTDKVPFLIGSLSRMMTWANFKALFKTINGNYIFGSGNIITPDMDTTTPQDVLGMKTFRDGKFGLRNVANTFTSFFVNTVTASRTWTFPDKNGTVAMTSDIVEKLSGGVSNYLIKFNSATTGVLSRIIDTGTYLGIGTVNTPTKDITLGNQANRTIGVEESDSVTPGRDFIRTAGKTTNYASADFIALNITSRNIEDYYSFGTDMYAVTNSGQLLKQTNSTGDFAPSGTTPSSQTWRFVIDYAFNFYFATWGNNNIYKQAGASGTSSIIQTFSSRINALALNGNDLYIFTQTDIYIQSNLTGAFVALGQSLNDSSNSANACASPTGNVYYIVQNVLYKRTGSTGLFVNTGISATAIHITPNNNVYISGGNRIQKQINEAGAFINLNQVSRDYFMLGGNAIGNVYSNVKNSDTYLQLNYAVGVPDLDGGTLKDYAGSGKGVGKSRIQRYTGQKTASGTDMQIDTLREEIDENGHYLYLTHPVYASDAAADADSNLRSKAYYKITGNRGIFQKP